MAHYLAPPPCAPERAADYARQCAAEWVSDPETVLLDTETTSLDGWPVEVAVRDMSGRGLFDSCRARPPRPANRPAMRSEEHTSELQSRGHVVCRRLLAEQQSARPLTTH